VPGFVGGVVEAAVGERVGLGAEVSVTVVHAEHYGRREPGGPRALAVGHVVETADAAVWLAGDTGPHPSFCDFPHRTRRGGIDVAVVPVSGWGLTLGPEHLDPKSAAEAVVQSGATRAVPVHWGTLHPIGLRTVMRSRLAEPGHRFSRHLDGTDVTAYVLPVGGHVTC
jgi:L-ascorbate metabolism protein UlaG (beta-lactamase superfamily)